MNKKKWVMIVTAILLVIGIFAIQKLISEGKIRTGTPESNFTVLTNGTYVFDDLNLGASEYAIYAVEGLGIVNVNGYDYELNSSLFEDVKNRGGGARYSILYEESPKINLVTESVIVVNGDANFKISFLRR